MNARASSKPISFDLGEEPAAEQIAWRSILDDLSVGIVLLDSHYRVQFVNHVFRRFWRIPDALAEARPPFIELLYQGRGSTVSSVSHYLLGEFVAKKMDLIRIGEEKPLQIRLSSTVAIQFRCKALPGGGRLLTYGNVSELMQQAETFKRLASIDAMTGVPNRRHFLSCAENEWERYRRYGGALSVLMVDIDRFKSINDQYGHDVGDVVIKAVAETLRKSKRAHDVVGRLGGEEFALMLLETTLDNAAIAGERFRQLVAAREIVVNERRIAVTISIGVSVSRPETTGISELLKEADLALYDAKHSGRNRVCRFQPAPPVEKSGNSQAA